MVGLLESGQDVYENVRSGFWIGDCFIFTNTANRLYYLVGEQPNMIAPFDKPMYLLGYQANKQRIYVADKDANITSYTLSLQLVEFQTLYLRGDIDGAEAVLATIESLDLLNKIARFLETQDNKERALEVAKDPDLRFDLALATGKLDIAEGIAEDSNIEQRWKVVGDAALSAFDLELAEKCFQKANDLGSQLLLYIAASNINGPEAKMPEASLLPKANGLRQLAKEAEKQTANNVAFSCLWSMGDVDACIDLLLRTDRLAEAVFLSRSYRPSRCRNIVDQWKFSLEKSGKTKVSRILAVPPGPGENTGNANDDFPNWDQLLQDEESQVTQDSNATGLEDAHIGMNGGTDSIELKETPVEGIAA